MAYSHTLDTTTYTKDAWVYKPDGFDAAPVGTYPVLIYFHGAGAVGAGSSAVLTDGTTTPTTEIEADNFGPSGVGATCWDIIVVSPYLVSGGWIASTPAFIDSVVDDATNLKIDIEKMFLTGLSLGGNPCSAQLGMESDNANWRQLRGVYPIAGGITVLR